MHADLPCSESSYGKHKYYEWKCLLCGKGIKIQI